MTDGLEADVEGADDVAQQRDELATRVRTHAGRIARELAVLQGGDYGQKTFTTDAGSWTLKYEAGDVQYLRYEPQSGSEIYAVSSKQPPEPDALERAMTDYEAFVAAFNEYVRSFEGLFADVPDEFPEVESTAELAAQRDRTLERIREVCTAMAGQLHRYDGDYGTYATTIDGTRWELKWDGDAVSYLRVGGEDGIYLLSQYGPPPAPEVRRLVDDVPAFVTAFNDHVEDLEADLETVAFESQ
ncbi:hypothetical protein Natpe_3182 [Natrinema pellirubrum DSM 15624]|uniref:Profilin fold domain-containing protein n=1 Tax=Natrinema pellirubrum (strain DSM 15624 / CIP 106293 / JCM 10476 / NCIMB 786 / 157) TaxID=797303 RepID=L0JQ65_NATP1|nr:hypothetical protein [Natrinema pellirubrum]AGB32973.1 hypothetical protein Natpe_3182 [Natrinema pellirubrum DSM 15624]